MPVELQPGFKALALRLQEAGMMHSDVSARLSDAVNDAHRGTGNYGYYITHDGDGQSGNVVYSSGGDIRMCPYEIGSANGKAATNLDMDNSKNVVPVTTYQEEAEDHDHYTSMDEAFRKDGLYTDLPLYERFISQKTRKQADSGSFAGKGRSFPILKAEDVSAALHSIGRAGPSNYSSDTLRSNIKRIAKAKGFALPDSLKDDDGKESAREADILGDVIPLREGAVGQDGTAYLKLIAPGWGSSGYYSKEVLKRDGPKIFKAGTKNFWNHQTESEERERPEGDLRDLAGVLTEDAHWEDGGPAGAGLYAKTSVQPHFREHVDSLAKHIGMSIRARGTAKEGEAEGKRGPIIEKLTQGTSVDYVTTPGAGGKILQLFEAARGARKAEGDDMDEAQIKAIVTAAVKEAVAPLQAENTRLRETMARQDAPRAVAEALRDIRIPGPVAVVEATRARIIRNITPVLPLDANGAIDGKKLGEMVEAEVIAEAQYLAHMGYGIDVQSIGKRMTEAEIAKQGESQQKEAAEQYGEAMDELCDIFIGPKLVKGSVSEAARDARKTARKAFKEGRAA